MTFWILLLTLCGLVALARRLVLALARKDHDPVEYYRGWRGYRHPIKLENRITKEEAEAITADGAAYLVGYFDDGRLMRVVKFLRGEFFFEYLYSYHPNGRLKSARVTRRDRVTLLEYDSRGRRLSNDSIAF
jgi:hypothetical protein